MPRDRVLFQNSAHRQLGHLHAVYWSTEFILGSCDLEVSAHATVMMAPAHGSLPTSAEPQMASHCSERIIALPRGWTKRVKSALIQSVSLAATALTLAHGRSSSSRSPRKRMAAELDRANTEIALLKEELEIKDARWRRLPSRRRPYYTPVQRMRILQLKAARGWSCEQAAATAREYRGLR